MPLLNRVIAHLALWTLIALGFAFALAFTEQLAWGAALADGFATVLPAALLALLIPSFCARVPLRRTAPLRLLAVHAIAAGVFSTLWCAAILGEMVLSTSREPLTRFARAGVPWQLVMGIVVYALSAGLAYERLARQREEEQTRAVERAETLRLRAELGALRARLDPHFLFNVLQTLGTLVDHQPTRAHIALEHLAALLRRRLAADDSAEFASLGEELSDVRDYLALESLRFGDRLRILEEIADDTLDFHLPRFSLQPIVENALHHGLGGRTAGGVLRITTHRVGDHWTLVIADDGAGADPERFVSGTGIGVSVVRERLRLRFGERMQFNVITEPGKGCCIQLVLPSVADDDDFFPATRFDASQN